MSEASAPAIAVESPSLAADLITLTKPRIISLLLITTIAPMFITPAGLPSWSQIGWVALGGYLMAGGANAINMWFDRDIDDKMVRTRTRPIPAGRIAAGPALCFGLTLGAVSFVLFWRFVNPLSAWLALGGLAFYVLVYTVWLKRLSPQNIVIGGAAGAFPPMVGWAAMTGSISLGALYLFAIIFYWTPPHFWALALNKQRDYGAAGIPMMPNVHGVHETKRQMLLYTLMLIPLTIMPSVVGITGLLYGIAAILLGVRFVQLCWRIVHEEGVTPTTWKLYKYSLSYLALLFVAMAADRWIPFGHRAPPRETIILDQPAAPGATVPMAMPMDSGHAH
jgi:protoheme IX farnesyltransferase